MFNNPILEEEADEKNKKTRGKSGTVGETKERKAGKGKDKDRKEKESYKRIK